MRTLKMVWLVMFATLAALGSSGAGAEASYREQMKGLDEQVQEIKTDVLGIAAELSRLEEKLLYPSNTQLAIFVSLAEGDTFRLDSCRSTSTASSSRTTSTASRSSRRCSTAACSASTPATCRPATTRSRSRSTARSTGGDDFNSTETFPFDKGVEPKLLGIALNGPTAIELGEW